MEFNNFNHAVASTVDFTTLNHPLAGSVDMHGNLNNPLANNVNVEFHADLNNLATKIADGNTPATNDAADLNTTDPNNAATSNNEVEFNNYDQMEGVGVGRTGEAPIPESFWIRYNELTEYCTEHGNANVPFSYESNRQLGRWVSKQRENYKKKKLSKERIDLLQLLDFMWDARTQPAPLPLFVASRPPPPKPKPIESTYRKNVDLWEKIPDTFRVRYNELADYFRTNGNSDVPFSYESNRQLGKWVSKQRENYKLKKMTSDRVELLEMLSFSWDARNKRNAAKKDLEFWETRYAELGDYVKEHANADVPSSYAPNRPLGNWVKMQRKNYKLGKLSDERTERLKIHDFKFGIRSQDIWEDRFNELVDYAKDHGDCDVPTSYEANLPLGRWVSAQRGAYKKKELSSYRVERLRACGFKLENMSTSKFYSQLWEMNDDELAGYVKKTWKKCICPSYIKCQCPAGFKRKKK